MKLLTEAHQAVARHVDGVPQVKLLEVRQEGPVTQGSLIHLNDLLNL